MMAVAQSSGHLDATSGRRKLVLGTAVLLGAIMLGNGLVMLWDPWWWYTTAPGVGRTGLFNPHFVRDIGYTYALVGIAFVGGAFRLPLRLAFWAPATLWLTFHALFHFWEVAVGICGPAQLAIDFPAVTLPSLIGVGLTIWAWRGRGDTLDRFDPRASARLLVS